MRATQTHTFEAILLVILLLAALWLVIKAPKLILLILPTPAASCHHGRALAPACNRESFQTMHGQLVRQDNWQLVHAPGTRSSLTLTYCGSITA
jgi:hypothetical protein